MQSWDNIVRLQYSQPESVDVIHDLMCNMCALPGQSVFVQIYVMQPCVLYSNKTCARNVAVYAFFVQHGMLQGILPLQL